MKTSIHKVWLGGICVLAMCCSLLASCGVYSFTGAKIDGKTIYFQVLENRARNIQPALSATLTQKIRERILSQTGLAPVNTAEADYNISGAITNYDVSVTGVSGTQTASQNRLTITIQIEFKNQMDDKANFEQSFSRFRDYDATLSLQQVENKLIEEIGNELADDIFNKAFVNW
jgi:hypothetical protein